MKVTYEPGRVTSDPRRVYPGAIEPYSRDMEDCYGAKVIHPGAKESHPREMEAHL